ncbi:hypothetical protein EGW08_012972 [Elysia chlorotica]|uniref:Uncharacterized protein n=1 Tax=Elysia chlorotica TaxID=188477 RepID=A0A433TCA8_ELYCH|nr:hypothetical protein EGW08_012972 [Elysia chlorotica]
MKRPQGKSSFKGSWGIDLLGDNPIRLADRVSLKTQATALDVHGKLRIRVRPDSVQNDTWVGIIENVQSTDDDDIGALYYVVAVIFIYGLSIVMMIASHIRKNKQDSQLRTYLKEMSNLRKTERREKVLHKMTDLAKREREKEEREAESKRRLQEKLRLTCSGGESGDDTESDVPTSATSCNQVGPNRRPLPSVKKAISGSGSPLGSVNLEDEGRMGVPLGGGCDQLLKGKVTARSSRDGRAGAGGRGRADDYLFGGRKDIRLSPSVSYGSSTLIRPPCGSPVDYTVPSALTYSRLYGLVDEPTLTYSRLYGLVDEPTLTYSKLYGLVDEPTLTYRIVWLGG